MVGNLELYRKVEEKNSVPIGSKWERTNQLGSHTTTERTNRRKGVNEALKRGILAGLRKQQTPWL
jgi:hypothetical protein